MVEDHVDLTEKVQVLVDDLEDEALNFAVHQSMGHLLKPLNDNNPGGQWVAVFGPPHDPIHTPAQNYSGSSILAIDLIQDARLGLTAPNRHSGSWVATFHSSKDDYPLYRSEAFELTVAVARCYVKTKRGETVKLPRAILQNLKKRK